MAKLHFNFKQPQGEAINESEYGIRFGFIYFSLFLMLLGLFTPARMLAAPSNSIAGQTVYVLPLRDEVEPSMVYLTRRGVREAMDQKADLLIVHLNTNGGRIDCTEDIMEALGRFNGKLGVHTLIDTKAISAGAFISSSTRQIWMTPGSVIGAATPVMMSPGGSGVEAIPESYQRKINSAVRAMMRASAEKNGHRPEVFNAMVDNSEGLIVEGKTIAPKGDLVTLTHTQAEAKYGQPARPLLSSGTVAGLETLIQQLAGSGAKVITVKMTGFEQLARWITMISPLLMGLGMLLGYLEFKTPGFGLFGIGAAICFAIYFFGHYVAGLSGHEAALLFSLGIVLLVVEFVIFPGLILPALIGFICIAVGLMMAMANVMPSGIEPLDLTRLKDPMRMLLLTTLGTFGVGWALVRLLPHRFVTSGMTALTVAGPSMPSSARDVSVGDIGQALTALRPSGRAQIQGVPVDVVSDGRMIEPGSTIRVVSVDAWKVVVVPHGDDSQPNGAA